MENASKAESFRNDFERLVANIGRVIVGQREVVEQVLLVLFAGGHALVEGLPGLGKTKLVSTLARSLSLSFSRIQFTPDLMPADITGTDVLVTGGAGAEIEFREGPVFTNVLLADEINRATPRTQSALLEVMEERTVTVMGRTRALDPPFFVFATQNPIELEGTYPLPEAQLDRFTFKVEIALEGKEEIKEILRRFAGAEEPAVEPVLSGPRVLEMQALVREAVLPEPVADFIASVVLCGTPGHPKAVESVRRYVRYGPSPRAALALALTARARALSLGRPAVDFDDVRAVALPALRHRLVLNFEGETSGVDLSTVIGEILDGARKDY